MVLPLCRSLIRMSFSVCLFFYRIQVVSVNLVRIPKWNNLNALPSDNTESLLNLSVAARLSRNNWDLYSGYQYVFWAPGGLYNMVTMPLLIRALSFKCCQLWCPLKSRGALCFSLDALNFPQPKLEVPFSGPIEFCTQLVWYAAHYITRLYFFVPSVAARSRPTLAFVFIFCCFFIRNCHKKSCGLKKHTFIILQFSWVRNKGTAEVGPLLMVSQSRCWLGLLSSEAWRPLPGLWGYW